MEHTVAMSMIKRATFEVISARVGEIPAAASQIGMVRTAHRWTPEYTPRDGYYCAMRTCGFGGCDKKHDSRGYCSGHARQFRSGETLRPLRQRATLVPEQCGVEGCGRTHYAKTLCRYHYGQARRGHSFRVSPQESRTVCEFPGCEKVHEGHGLCGGHNIQRRSGKTLTPLRRREVAGARKCSADGCESPHISRDLCVRHYNRWYWESSGGKAARKAALARRRARKASADVRDISRRDWLRLIRRYDGLCAYACGRPWGHMDHIIALDRGGRHSIGNVLPACATCNTRKRIRTIMEWKVASR